MGQRGVGRKTAVRMAAELQCATVYAIGQQEDKDLPTIMRDACMCAGLDKKKTVLLVDLVLLKKEEQHWETLLQLMREGNILSMMWACKRVCMKHYIIGISSNLFTSSEILVLSSKMHTGKVRRTADAALQALSQSIQPNLHVVVMWDVPHTACDGAIFDTVPMAASCSCLHEKPLEMDAVFVAEEHWRSFFALIFGMSHYVDYYQPWAKSAYSDMALQVWNSAQLAAKSSLDGSSIEALSFLAAQIHLTAIEVLKKVYPSQVGYLMSPKDYVRCLNMGVKIDSKLRNKNEVSEYEYSQCICQIICM